MKDNIKNILSIYKLATPQEIKDGIAWYLEAYKISNEIAIECELPLNIVVGVIASLSPNNKWDRNILNARDLIKAFLNGEHIESFKVSTYNAMKQKAWHIMETMPNHEETISILNGQKIVSFYRNIMGDDTCTVDGHAFNIWRNERHGLTTDKTNIGKKLYREIQDDYVEACKHIKTNGRNLKAFEMQAITWVTWRRINGIV